MSRDRTLKLIHLASTVWFCLSIIYILILTLRQAGVKWWILFSLSGHGLLISFTLISLYLFAIFRGVSSSQKVQIEHPLTSTNYYHIFYVITPLLGGLAGCIGMAGISTLGQFALGVALGTLGMTFLVWVIVDPLVGLLEPFVLSTSRKHRVERIAQAKVLRQKQNENRDILFRTRPGSVVRYGDWKLHYYFEDEGVELYNLSDDIGERNNLAMEKPEKTEELLSLLKNWWKETNAPVPTELNPEYQN